MELDEYMCMEAYLKYGFFISTRRLSSYYLKME